MKKLAFLMALMTVASLCLASCGGGTEDTTTPAASTTTAGSTTTRTPPPIITPGTDDEVKAPDLLSSENFALDGSLTEYEGLHTVSVVSTATSTDAPNANEKVIFYGAMTDAGLYLAADAYHDIYIGGAEGEWWRNSNFEIFIGATNAQKYAYAQGIDQACATSGQDVQAFMKTEELVDGDTKYHTVTEMYISVDYLNESDILHNSIDVGVAWKTIGDKIIGGAGTGQGANGEDEYWVPVGTWPNGIKPIVAPSGIYLPGEYDF